MRRLLHPVPVLIIGLGLAVVLAASPAAAKAEERPRPNLAALQSALESKGFYEGQVDGLPGPLTREAIGLFKRSLSKSVRSFADPAVRRALGWRGRPALGSRPIRLGHRGWDVAGLQYLLQRAGFGPGRVDGIFGPLTRQAVGRVQRDAGDLSVDGTAGRNTIGYLIEAEAPEPPGSVLVGSAGSGRFLRPVSGPLGNGYGAPRPGGRRHQGVDFPVARGTPIVASAQGTVIFAGWNSGGYGNLVVIQHSGGYTTWYAHLSGIEARTGQTVATGRRIGRVGSTGRSTGPHLHFEIRYFDDPLDPVPMLRGGRSGPSLLSFGEGSGSDSSGGTRSSGAGPDRGHRGRHAEECGHDREHRGARRAASRAGDWIARERLCH